MFKSEDLKLPHIGWKKISDLSGELFENIAEPSYVYFVHSFFVENGFAMVATCDYGVQFSAAIQYKKFYAVQFHTEKSGEVGEKILEVLLKI